MDDPVQQTLGIDFGTTNSVMAVASADGPPKLVQFPTSAGPSSVFRSLLFFDEDTTDARGRPIPWAGAAAIDRYHEMDGEGRLMQSMKSFLGSRHMNATQVFGASVPLESLIAMLLTEMRKHAERAFGTLPTHVVAGRPVRFAWSDDPDDALPVERLRRAFAQAGFENVTFEFEPVAAAYHHFRGRTERGSLVLVADFGGGTSDFSVLRWGDPPEVLGIAGVGVAGDALDAALVQEFVAPQLGKGATYRSIFGRDLVIPAWIYTGIKRWHELSVLKSPQNMRMLVDYQKQMAEPEKLGALIHLVENNIGYALYRSVARSKEALSASETTHFVFEDAPLTLDATITRPTFESLIEGELNALEASLDGLLDDLGIQAVHIDRCFLTGGTAHVPAVMKLFERRFGADRVHVGDHHTSVASGLALRGLDPHLRPGS